MNIKEFAKTIGVSTTTISSAVTGNGRISDATREMILQKMREMGYTPNLNARRLVSGRSYMVALTHIDQEAASDLFTMQVARAMVGPLKSLGYDLWLNLAPDSSEEQKLLRQLVRASTIDAVVIICEEVIPKKLLQELVNHNRQCVVVGHVPAENMQGVGSVVMNMRSGAQQVARLLVERGHRRIGFIDSYLRDKVSSFFIDELAELGVIFDQRYYAATSRAPEEGYKALQDLMSLPDPPTAIFARTDMLAISALRAARDMGLSIPQDLSIVGHDDLSLLAVFAPGLTTVRIDYNELADAATDVLSKLLSEPQLKQTPYIIDTSLVVRETVGYAGETVDGRP